MTTILSKEEHDARRLYERIWREVNGLSENRSLSLGGLEWLVVERFAKALGAGKRKETAAPTEPGWYFAIPQLAIRREMRPVRVHKLSDQLFVLGNNVPVPLDVFHWFGPVEIPEEDAS